ncbi:hypothetical protein EVAR_96159_1 [Eumeta japonica]|uniref:Uncharacterized protein n=1 Tax=Eumeta variegata TaxID=151549 RepID=A0A4C1VJT9_EUMVA|nr:hypothetical protein EVAR_96159_1 [Eumeta japonica]
MWQRSLRYNRESLFRTQNNSAIETIVIEVAVSEKNSLEYVPKRSLQWPASHSASGCGPVQTFAELGTYNSLLSGASGAGRGVMYGPSPARGAPSRVKCLRLKPLCCTPEFL